MEVQSLAYCTMTQYIEKNEHNRPRWNWWLPMRVILEYYDLDIWAQNL